MTTPAPTTAITPTSSALPSMFGERTDVYSLAKRIKLMVRGGDKLTEPEALALAQVSIATNLNPFIGEVWYIPGGGPMIGIVGARRMENETMNKKGGTSFPEFTPCDTEEVGAPDPNDVAAAFRCEIFDSHATAQYQRLLVETINTLRNCGSPDPVKEAREIVGPRPRWIGWGYSSRTEKSKMNKTSLARKRAEADALKKRIVVPFGVGVTGDEIAPAYETVEAEFVQPEPEKPTRSQAMDELMGTVNASTKYKTTGSTIVTRISKANGMTADELVNILGPMVSNQQLPSEMTLAEADELAKRINA